MSNGESGRRWCQQGSNESDHADLDGHCSDFGFFFFFQSEMDTFEQRLHFCFKRITRAVVQSLDCRRTSKQEDQFVCCCSNPPER